MVIYDFAGQQEYYSSHAAVLERIMRNSAAIFVCIVDLLMEKISESIHYWMSFIENACSSAQVGSHAAPQELKKKSSLVETINLGSGSTPTRQRAEMTCFFAFRDSACSSYVMLPATAMLSTSELFFFSTCGVDQVMRQQ